ncbi:hypothetical protein pb186bvf_010515 [Paramecium bursaria]
MISINRILNTKPFDPKQGSQVLLQDLRNILKFLRQDQIKHSVLPEQILQLLSTFHYLMIDNQIDPEEFQDCQIFFVTNILNKSFCNERLSTEMSSSSTFQPPSTKESTQQQSQFSGNKQDKVFQKRLECLKSFSDKIPKAQTNDPLTYQQMCQLYYTYLKKLSYLQFTGDHLTDCCLLQNISQIALRIIEGQRNQQLMYIFDLILKDLNKFEKDLIVMLDGLIQNNKNQSLQIFEVYQWVMINSKQIKWFCKANKKTCSRQQIKQFKSRCRQFVIENKQYIRQNKKQYNTERISQSDLMDGQFHEYERKQLYQFY